MVETLFSFERDIRRIEVQSEKLRFEVQTYRERGQALRYRERDTEV